MTLPDDNQIKEMIELAEKGLKAYGVEKQLIHVIQELAELIQAITKYLEGKEGSTTNLIEEFIHVEFMLFILRTILKENEISFRRHRRMNINRFRNKVEAELYVQRLD